MPKRRPSKDFKPLPEDFKVTAKAIQLAKENGWPDPHKQLEAFKDHHIANGILMVDWERAFYTWLRNAKQWKKGPPIFVSTARPRQALPLFTDELTDEQRKANQQKLADIMKGIGKEIH
jgi:hypothetical protein